jgi:hypothetical protein
VHHAADAGAAICTAARALQSCYRRGVPIEFQGETYETIAEAIEAIRARVHCP